MTRSHSVDAQSEAAEMIARAAATGIPSNPVRSVLGSADVAAAYAVQEILISRRLAAGRRTVGRKIGLTNPAVQSQLGVDQPDFGVLLDDMAWDDGATVDSAWLLQPRIEAEVAFVLATDLDGPGPISVDQVSAAIAYATAALEIVDSRIAGWDIGIVDTIADNASCGGYVLGSRRVGLGGDFSPVDVRMTLHRDGELVSSGGGTDCLGDPLAAVAWLAETVRNHGRPLRAGEVVLSGALGPMVGVDVGATYRAELSTLGPVSVSFAGNAIA